MRTEPHRPTQLPARWCLTAVGSDGRVREADGRPQHNVSHLNRAPMNLLQRSALLLAIALGAVATSELWYYLEVQRQEQLRDAQPPRTFADEVARALAADTGLGDRLGQYPGQRFILSEPAACRRLLDSLGVVNPTSRALLDSNVVSHLVAQKPCDLRRNPPKLGLDLIDEEDLARELRNALLLLGLLMGIAVSHSNRGWRRLALAVGAIGGGVCALYLSTQGEEPIWPSMLVAVSIAAVVVAVKEIVEWVRAGFSSDA